MSEPARDAGVDARVIAWVGAALGLVVVAAVALVFGWRHFSSMRPARPEPVAIAPGAPALQPAPLPERQAYDLDKAVRLGSYGWVDRASGIVHVPIDLAMQRLAERAGPPPAAAPRAAP